MWKKKKMNTFGILYSWFLAKVCFYVLILLNKSYLSCYLAIWYIHLVDCRLPVHLRFYLVPSFEWHLKKQWAMEAKLFLAIVLSMYEALFCKTNTFVFGYFCDVALSLIGSLWSSDTKIDAVRNIINQLKAIVLCKFKCSYAILLKTEKTINKSRNEWTYRFAWSA